MCCRPVIVTKPQVCHNCEKKIPATCGIKPIICPFCNIHLKYDDDDCVECALDDHQNIYTEEKK